MGIGLRTRIRVRVKIMIRARARASAMIRIRVRIMVGVRLRLGVRVRVKTSAASSDPARLVGLLLPLSQEAEEARRLLSLVRVACVPCGAVYFASLYWAIMTVTSIG